MPSIKSNMSINAVVVVVVITIIIVYRLSYHYHYRMWISSEKETVTGDFVVSL